MKTHSQRVAVRAMLAALRPLLLRKKALVPLLIICAFASLSPLSAQTFTFTNAGAVGQNGPNQAKIDSAYAGTTLDGMVSSTAGIQYWIVPTTGRYKLEAYGAQGYGTYGGRGAYMSGEVILTAGDTLKIVVGQKAPPPVGSVNQYAGGGGSFVTYANNTPILVAGGGGGSWATSYTSVTDASITTSGNTAANSANIGAGGTGGNGGATANSADGGGGFTTNGGGTGGGFSFVNGAVGGKGTTAGHGEGGFGGGGGTSSWDNYRCGGGGGYSGGGGAGQASQTGNPEAGGGGSYNAANNQNNMASVQTGNGKVVISILSTGAFNDVGVISIDSPTVFCEGNHPVVVTVRNFGSNKIDSLRLNWTVNGTLQTVKYFIGSLDTFGGAGSATAQVNIGSYTFTSTPHSIRVWTSFPNGGSDTLEANDTAVTIKQPNLPAPTALVASTVDSTSAAITWAAGSTTNTFAYVNSTVSTTPTGPGTILSADSVILTGLTRATRYYFYVREICSSGDSSTWAGPISYKTNCSGPLNGTYTINSSQAPSNSNFVSLNDALEALYSCTISGPVTFNVAANSGPFSGGAELTAITGASASNTVTLNGNGNVINESAAGYFLALNGVSYLTINDFQFINTVPSVAKFGIMLRGASHHVAITNNLINMGTGYTGTTGACIVVSNVTTSAITAGNCAQYVTISDNELVGGYYGITLMGAASYLNNYGHVVSNNIIRDFYMYGVYMSNADSLVIEKNDISRLNRPSYTTFYGTYMSTCRNIKILQNSIHGSGPGSYSAYPIYITTSVNSSTHKTEIVNNRIYDIPTTGTLYGIYGLGTRNHINVYHNTMDLAPSGTGAIRSIFWSSAPDNHDVKNNIFSIRGNGTGIKFFIYVTTNSTTFTSNNNVMYMGATAGTNHIGFWTANQTNIGAWRTATSQDVNSKTDNPQYTQISSGNVLPLSNVVDNMGTPVGVSTDILGNGRSSSTPDAGAYEFTGLTSDLALTSAELIHENSCYNSSDTAEFVITNAFGSTVNFATDSIKLLWNVSGPINSSGSVVINTGTLAASASQTVTVTSVNMSVPGTYTLNAYIQPNTANPNAFNDTLEEASELIIKPILAVSPKLDTFSSYSDSVQLSATSTLFPGGGVSITEVKHNHVALGAPVAGWPSYMATSDYIEITGVPNSDLGGYKYEAWSGTAMHYSYTFPAGTVFSPNGTMIFVMGQVGASTASPSNYYYVISGVTSFDFQSGGPGGHLIKDANGVIVDAVFIPSTTVTTFPTAANVSTADWSGTLPSGSATCGHRRIGADVNTATNWVVSSATYPQDPNSVNSGVTVPIPGIITGFSWKLNGNVVDTIPSIYAGPYSTHGSYKYIASYSNVCGTFYDTAIVTVPAIIDLAADLDLPSTITCGNDLPIEVEISNEATEDIDFSIDNATITVEVTGQSNQTFTMLLDDNSFNGNQPLEKGSSMIVSLGNLNIDATGTYYLVASVNVNYDSDSGNNEDAVDTIRLNTIADAGLDYQVCSGSPATIGGNPTAIGGTGPFNYMWTPSSFLANANTATPQATVSSNTYFSVKVTDNLGCYSMDSMLVEALSTPSPVVSGNTSVCQGISTYSTGFNAGTTYEWTVTGGTIVGSSTNETVNVEWSQAGTGSVRVKQTITAGGCFIQTAPYAVTINAKPSITYTATGATTFCAGGSVNLLAIPQTGFSYSWKKNGSTISGANSNVLTANTSGNYNVVVTNTHGCSDSATAITVTVNPLPTATITPSGSSTVCSGDSVILNANSGSGLSYQWLLNGATITGATANSYSAKVQGNYTLLVTNTNSCTASSAQQTVTVNPKPTASIVALGATTVCQGQNVYLSAVPVSGASYQWRLNGSAISGATTANYTASASGSYTILVTSSLGCTDLSNAISVTVNALPSATITPSGATSFCDGGSVDLDANTGTGLTYQWMLNGTEISSATSATYTASAQGNYTVEVTNAGGCSRLSQAEPVVVSPIPTASIIAMGPVTFCQGSNVYLSAIPVSGATYEWRLNGNTITGATSATYMATSSGNYTVQVTSFSSCSNVSNMISVTVNSLPVASITPSGPTNFCDGGSVNLVSGAASGASHQWMVNGLPISGATASSYTASQSGVYSLSVTSPEGCQLVSSAVTVMANPLPMAVIIFTGPTSICQGESSLLVGLSQSGYTYQWLRDGNPISGATSNTYSADQSGNYSMQVTSLASCSAVSSATSITVNPMPAALITPAGPTSVCSGNLVVLNANTGTGLSYQWYHNGNVLNNATASSYTAVISGNYTVKVTSASGCNQLSALTNVTIHPSPTASITAIGSTSICDGSQVTLQAATVSNGTYQWKQDGATLSGANSISFNAQSAGNYTALVTDVITGCFTESNLINVDVSPLPIAMFVAEDICLGGDISFNNGSTVSSGTLSYSWNFDDNTSSTDENPTHTFTSDGAYSVTLTATSNVGINCQAVYTSGVSVFPVPDGSFTWGYMGNNLVNFTANDATGTSYNWDFGDDSTSTEMNVQHLYSGSGTYDVTLLVSNSFGCQMSSTESIILDPTSVQNKNGNKLNFGVYPNPFTTETKISYELIAGSEVNIEVYDQLGRLVQSFTKGRQEPGAYIQVLNTGDMAPQTLIVRLIVDNQVYNQKIVLVP